MLTKLSEKLGEGLAEHWMLTVFSPAFVFWGGGGIIYVMSHDLAGLQQKWDSLSLVIQVTLIIGSLILIVFSSTIVERIQTEILKVLQGYWPSWLSHFRFWLAKRWWNKIEGKYSELDTLVNAIRLRDIARRSQLDNELSYLPVKSIHTMPTHLGNLLSATQRYSDVRYRLDSITCWPRLYPLLSETLRLNISSAQDRLYEEVRLFVWSVLFLIWAIWQWWAIIALLVAYLAYHGMVVSAFVYGDLIRAAYDLHRFDLYKSLNWPLPKTPEEEENAGKELTEYLSRGHAPTDFAFIRDDENGKSKS